MARPPKDPALRMAVDLRIPVTEEQKKIIAEAASAAQLDVATWARPALLNAARRQIAKSEARSSASPALPWITQVIELERAGKTEQSLDVIFDTLDEMLLAAKFDACASTLSLIPTERLTNAQLLTVLTATAPAKDKLRTRKGFYEDVERTLNNRGADAANLLSGLE